MPVYNQKTDDYLRNACILVTLLNIMKYNFGIEVYPNFIMKVAIFFDKLGVWFPSFGGYSKILYPAFISSMNKKLDLNFKLNLKYISLFSGTDTLTYGIGTANYNKIWVEAQKKGIITKKDIDDILAYTGKGYGHAVAWDYDKGGYLINTDGTKPYKFTLEVLKYGQEKGLFRNPMRTILPEDKETKEIVRITKRMAIEEMKGNTYRFLDIDMEYKDKAINLYNHSKENKIY